jgi:hypothetical protein
MSTIRSLRDPAKRCLGAFALVSLTLFFSPQALRADQPVALSGTIVDWEWRPVAGALISVRAAGSSVIAHVNADKRGNFALLASAGDLEITAESTGHEPCDLTMRLAPGDRVRTNFRARKQPKEITHIMAKSYYCDVKWASANAYDRYVIQ